MLNTFALTMKLLSSPAMNPKQKQQARQYAQAWKNKYFENNEQLLIVLETFVARLGQAVRSKQMSSTSALTLINRLCQLTNFPISHKITAMRQILMISIVDNSEKNLPDELSEILHQRELMGETYIDDLREKSESPDIEQITITTLPLDKKSA